MDEATVGGHSSVETWSRPIAKKRGELMKLLHHKLKHQNSAVAVSNYTSCNLNIFTSIFPLLKERTDKTCEAANKMNLT